MKYIGNIIYDEELLEDGNHFVIFGAGKYGKKILQYMDANKVKKNVICFFFTYKLFWYFFFEVIFFGDL